MVTKKRTSLSAVFIREQSKRLSEELERLEKKLKSLKKFPDYGTSPDDTAQEVAEFSTDNPIANKIKQSIIDIKIALKAIDKGDYGICSVCHESIMKGRLEVMPEAITCSAHHKTKK